MLKPFLALSAVVFLSIAASPALMVVNGAAAQEGSGNPVKPTPASQEKAKKLYAQDCAMCHGDAGDGKTDLAKDMQLTLTDWSDPKTLGAMSDQQLFDVVRKGKDKMPPEDASRAKNDDVWNLIIYIRALSKNHPAAPAAPAAPADAPAPAAPAAPSTAAPAPAAPATAPSAPSAR